MYVCLCVYACEYRCLQRPEVLIRSTTAGVTDSCALPNMVLGIRLQAPGKIVCALNHTEASFHPSGLYYIENKIIR